MSWSCLSPAFELRLFSDPHFGLGLIDRTILYRAGPWTQGLLSDSITINDDFQQLMFMAQSRGVQLLERRSCGLKRKEFHEVVELLGRMVREQCVAPEFWGDAWGEIGVSSKAFIDLADTWRPVGSNVG